VVDGAGLVAAGDGVTGAGEETVPGAVWAMADAARAIVNPAPANMR